MEKSVLAVKGAQVAHDWKQKINTLEDPYPYDCHIYNYILSETICTCAVACDIVTKFPEGNCRKKVLRPCSPIHDTMKARARMSSISCEGRV